MALAIEPVGWHGLLHYHRSLIADSVRTSSYQQAIAATVRPNDVVADIGSGTGLLALFACRAGARRVYAIDAGPAIELARQIAPANGLADSVVFIEDVSYYVDLPEAVDVLVTETLWNLGLGEGLLGTVMDARDRFLRGGGALIPRSIELIVCPVEAPASYEGVDTWGREVHGVRLAPVREFAANQLHNTKLDPPAFLSEPALLARVGLEEATSSDVTGHASFVATRDGVMHGVGGWFAAQLAAGVRLSNEPPLQTPNWNHVLFPLERPIEVREGGTVEVGISSTANGSIWSWQVEFEGGRWEHSTFRGFPLSMDDARRTAADRAPEVSRRGEAESFVLARLTGRNTSETIQGEVLKGYPDVVRSATGASAFVEAIVRRCT